MIEIRLRSSGSRKKPIFLDSKKIYHAKSNLYQNVRGFKLSANSCIYHDASLAELHEKRF